MLTDNKCTSGGDYLMTWVTGNSLCCILETNIRLYINFTSTKHKTKKEITIRKEETNKNPNSIYFIEILANTWKPRKK